jgi:GH25 family lysozyme M1 (1,4-beta-N-acetylmuramidase)
VSSLLLRFFPAVLLSICCGDAYAAADCSDPPIALPKREWCDYFKQIPYRGQNDPGRRVDTLVKASMNVPNADDASIRSYAFVISIWDYKFPGATSGELAAIENEQKDIRDFLQEQGFDEAAILKNGEATPDVIRSLFAEYFIPKIYSDYVSGRKVRFMFIFDGHGWRPSTDDAPGALALSALEGESDPTYAHRFSLAELRALLQDLSPYTQSVIALLGSCYAGSVLGDKPHGEAVQTGPSAWIAAAAPGWSEAWVSPGKKGTIFLQAVMSAVRSWEGAKFKMPDDDQKIGVNFSRATPRLTEIVNGINDDHGAGENPETHQPYPPIVVDTVSTFGNRNVAYRFVASNQLPPQIKTVLSEVKFTGSSVVGRPDIKVVLTPEQYKIRGVALSHYNFPVDFNGLKSAGVRFVYAKATQGASFYDRTFDGALKSAADAGIDIGAYHFFQFCEDVDAQFGNLRARVPRDKKLLPLALDVEWNMRSGPGGMVETKPTDCGTVTELRANLLKLLEKVEAYYGSRPIIYTATAFDKNYRIFDESFQKYPLWLADYSKQAKSGGGPGALAANPWTIWQVGFAESLPGFAGKKFDLNLFFGNEQDYETFRKGKTNVALEAAQGQRASSIPQ